MTRGRIRRLAFVALCEIASEVSIICFRAGSWAGRAESLTATRRDAASRAAR
jgi:hypothetical protein